MPWLMISVSESHEGQKQAFDCNKWGDFDPDFSAEVDDNE